MSKDFNDSIADILGGKPTPRPTQERLPDPRTPQEKLAEHMARTAEGGSFYVHQCEKCGGSGFWKGNRRFPCYVCKGKGTRTFKTSPAQRAKARAKSAEKRVEREYNKTLWREQHTDEIVWTRRAAARNAERGGTFAFPQHLIDALEQYGTWTDGQLAAVQRLMARDAARRRR